MDDKKIVRYNWERDAKSLAAGVRVSPLRFQSLLFLTRCSVLFITFIWINHWKLIISKLEVFFINFWVFSIISTYRNWVVVYNFSKKNEKDDDFAWLGQRIHVVYDVFDFQDVLNGSDHEAVLQLVNLVAGKYIFKLTVFDAEGLSSSDTANLHVKEGTFWLSVLMR